jgi:hypothetical protein
MDYRKILVVNKEHRCLFKNSSFLLWTCAVMKINENVHASPLGLCDQCLSSHCIRSSCRQITQDEETSSGYYEKYHLYEKCVRFVSYRSFLMLQKLKCFNLLVSGN